MSLAAILEAERRPGDPGAGAVIGLALGAASTHGLRGLLFEVQPSEKPGLF